MSEIEQRIRSYIDGYADGRKDALRDVEAVLSKSHSDSDIRAAAIGIKPASEEAV